MDIISRYAPSGTNIMIIESKDKGLKLMTYDVDRATHKVVRGLARSDEQDTLFSRQRPVPDGPEERLGIDRPVAAFIPAVGRPGESAAQIDAAAQPEHR